MQYTDLTRKELQREYSRLTRKYTDFIRQPVELDLTTEDPLPGCANRRAVKHFGTVLDKELRDTGAAHPAQAPDAVAALGADRAVALAADPAAQTASSAAGHQRLADLLERLPEVLDTQVGERGLALSGGEVQRIAIARALLKDAPILLLDEPTAHVDLTSEQDILRALDHAARGRTTLTISHRAATIADATRRVELADGTLA